MTDAEKLQKVQEYLQRMQVSEVLNGMTLRGVSPWHFITQPSYDYLIKIIESKEE